MVPIVRKTNKSWSKLKLYQFFLTNQWWWGCFKGLFHRYLGEIINIMTTLWWCGRQDYINKNRKTWNCSLRNTCRNLLQSLFYSIQINCQREKLIITCRLSNIYILQMQLDYKSKRYMCLQRWMLYMWAVYTVTHKICDNFYIINSFFLCNGWILFYGVSVL